MPTINWIHEPDYHDDDTREFWPISVNMQPLVTMIDLDGEEHTGIRRGGPQWVVMNAHGWMEKKS